LQRLPKGKDSLSAPEKDSYEKVDYAEPVGKVAFIDTEDLYQHGYEWDFLIGKELLK